jgi:hypothetical protein
MTGSLTATLLAMTVNLFVLSLIIAGTLRHFQHARAARRPAAIRDRGNRS